MSELDNATPRVLRQPDLLIIGKYVSTFAAGIILVLLILAPFGAGDFTIDGETVSGAEFLRRGGGITFAAIGALLVAIAVGLWRGRAWVRPLMMQPGVIRGR